ncbi:MAG: hypothetical protein CVU89_12285 [Firmicutes bacterium HGW-Firmicutes-14]|nr:MAG: hypothetical protein CVU89_12285 [Firmicutes bacterium HGW-Firmicutes-14]
MVLNLKNVLTCFERYVKKAMREWRVPGMAVSVVKEDRLIYARGFGVKKLGSSSRVNEKTVFQIGSVSKSFTAALVSKLVDEGRFGWKDRVKDYLPEFRLYDPPATGDFRVEDLMSQRSGLPPHSGRLLPHLGFSRKYIINNLHLIKPSSSFRSEYSYQNNLFLAAADLVEKQTGKSWEQNLLEKFLIPLNMVSTTATLKAYRSLPNTAHGHYYARSGPEDPVTALSKNWPYYYWVYTIAPAGGINSNVIDISRWVILHLREGVFDKKRLVSTRNIKFLQAPMIDAGLGPWGETRRYCQGWIRSEYYPYPILWHNGGTSGMKSIVAMVPEAGIGITVLCNLSGVLFPEAISRYWLDLWFGKTPHDWSGDLLRVQKAETRRLEEPPAPYTPPRPLRYYSGTYYNSLYGLLTVVSHSGSLVLVMGRKKIRKKLALWGGDTFVLHWPGVINEGAGVQFYGGRSGIVESVEIEGMNDDLTGVFTKVRL